MASPDKELTITIQRGRHDKENPYVMISKKMLRDPSISPKAKGILCYLLSLPDTWQTHPRQVASALGVGKDQVYAALNELLKEGYAIKRESKGEKGRFGHVIYEFYEEKLDPELRYKEKSTVSGNPDTGNPDTENPTIENTDFSKDTPLGITPPIPPQKEAASAESTIVDGGDDLIPTHKPTRTRAPSDFSPTVRDLATKMLNALVEFNPTYCPPKDLKPFLAQVAKLVDQGHKPALILQVLEWALADNVQRGDFNGWSSVMYSKNPANTLREKFSKLYQQMNTKAPKKERKFAPSSDDERSLEKFKKWAEKSL